MTCAIYGYPPSNCTTTYGDTMRVNIYMKLWNWFARLLIGRAKIFPVL